MKRFNQAWLLDPSNAESYHGFAVLSADQGATEETVTNLFRHSLVGHDVKPAAYVDFGLYLGRAGRHAEAIDLFKQALAIDPKVYDARRNLAAASSKLGRRGDACTYAKASLASGDSIKADDVTRLCSAK